jgi:hypothetical protein
MILLLQRIQRILTVFPDYTVSPDQVGEEMDEAYDREHGENEKADE